MWPSIIKQNKSLCLAIDRWKVIVCFVDIKKYIAVIFFAILSGCANRPTSHNVFSTHYPVIIPSHFSFESPLLNEYRLLPDGPQQGKKAEQLIREFAGSALMSSFGLEADGQMKNVILNEGEDDFIGYYFTFSSTIGRDKKQPIKTMKPIYHHEINSDKKANNALAVVNNDMVIYRWKFKLNEGVRLSRNATHFFQINTGRHEINSPLLTISGHDKQGQWLTLNHQNESNKRVLGKAPLQAIIGRWVQVSLRIDYRHDGRVDLTMTDIKNKRTVMDLSFPHINMWKNEDVMRPQWGIYHSSPVPNEERKAQQEDLFFTDLIIQKRQALLNK